MGDTISFEDFVDVRAEEAGSPNTPGDESPPEAAPIQNPAPQDNVPPNSPCDNGIQTPEKNNTVEALFASLTLRDGEEAASNIGASHLELRDTAPSTGGEFTSQDRYYWKMESDTTYLCIVEPDMADTFRALAADMFIGSASLRPSDGIKLSTAYSILGTHTIKRCLSKEDFETLHSTASRKVFEQCDRLQDAKFAGSLSTELTGLVLHQRQQKGTGVYLTVDTKGERSSSRAVAIVSGGLTHVRCPPDAGKSHPLLAVFGYSLSDEYSLSDQSYSEDQELEDISSLNGKGIFWEPDGLAFGQEEALRILREGKVRAFDLEKFGDQNIIRVDGKGVY